MAAVPAVLPDTNPLTETVAMPVAPLLHVPPVVKSPRGVVVPAQIFAVPVIPAGDAFIVIGFVTVQLVPPNE